MAEGQAWATLVYAKGERISAAFKRWFFNSTASEQARGDMACMTEAQYDACVRPTRMVGSSILFKMYEMYPTRCAYLLIFKESKEFCELYVLGIVSFAMLRDRFGSTISEVDLYDDSMRSRACMAPRHLEEEEEDSNAAVAALVPPFPLPIHIMARDTTMQARIERMCHSVNMAAIWDYRKWLLTPWSRASIEAPPGGPAGTTRDDLQRAHIEAGCSLFCALLGDYMEFVSAGGDARRAHRLAYECKRIDTERMLFYSRMDACVTETSLVELLAFNNVAAVYERGTALDYQAFWTLYPYARYEPRSFLMGVPLEDVDADSVASMPRYPGGIVHVPCYAPAVARWLWARHANSIQRRFTLLRRAQFDAMLVAQPRVAEWLHDECKVLETLYIVDNVNEEEEVKKKKHKTERNFKELAEGTAAASGRSDKRPKGVDRRAPDAGGYDPDDIEELWKRVPPCLAQMRKNGYAPKNEQRLRGTQIMWGGDVSVRAMDRMFRPLNDKYPNKGESYETRFPLNAYIMTPHNTTRCGNLVVNALSRATDKLQCPFAHELAQPGMTHEQVTPLCRAKCGARGGGPHDVIRNNMV